MSDLSAAAAAALGLPEAIVMRSAAARATETGMSVDEVLTAWAEGGSIEGAAPSEPAEAQAAPPSVGETPTGPPAEQGDNPPPSVGETPTGPPAEQGDSTPLSVGEVPTGPPAEPGDSTPSAPSRPTPAGKPPTLVGEPDRPMTVLAGVIGLFVAIVLVGLVGPSIATENPGARTSAVGYSEAGLQGQEIYQNLGCGSCHTQMVRPIVSDVGLGAVTLNDSNQVLGTRRFGPDLSNVGTRHPAGRIEAVVEGLDDHPAAVLSDSDLDDLVTYLLESATAAPDEPEPPADEPPAETPEAGAQP